MKKWILRIMAILLVLIISGIAYLKFALPNVKAPENLKITATPEMIKRGEYLANYVTMCVDCHSTRDWSKFSGPLIESTIGKGGEAFLHEYGFPGNFYSKNLTPFNLKTGLMVSYCEPSAVVLIKMVMHFFQQCPIQIIARWTRTISLLLLHICALYLR